MGQRRLLTLWIGTWIIAGLTLSWDCRHHWISPGSTSPSGYKVTDLGTLGGEESYASGINDKSQVVGRAQTAVGDWHAFVWERGRMRDLGTLGGDFSEARGINRRGDVVGRSKLRGAQYGHAFLYARGKMQDLGSLGDGSFANALNDRDQVVGSTSVVNGKGDHQAFLYSNGKMTVLGTMGGRDSVAWAINNKGEVVGESHTSGIETWTSHAFLYRGHALEDLGTLGGRYSKALGINDQGEIGGCSRTSDSPWSLRAFLWKSGSMRDVGSLTGGACVVTGMNSKGDMIGFEWGKDGQAYLFVRIDGGFKDLRGLVQNPAYGLFVPKAINDRGEIVIDGDCNRTHRALLLTPIYRRSAGRPGYPALVALVGMLIMGAAAVLRGALQLA